MSMVDRLEKWAVVQAIVVAHMPYGLRVRVPSGEIGVVDRVFVADLPTFPSDWPRVGRQITVVCAGYTTGGQLRLSARQSHIDVARQTPNSEK
ncbi:MULTISPECIES: hypothetical protein [unclassified Frankia]|uniref:hypothetical protein n=1 Tax=unclassified Frankia TaxID=2632575 RepID=UPI002AD334CA|nr:MULTISPECIES: hypothetical protein [unclassified Frankia]